MNGVRLLFVCNQGRHRSRTAAELLSNEHETRYRGVYDNPLMIEDLAWADVVVVMEDHQREEIAGWFPLEYLRTRIVTRGIPDAYSYGDPELTMILRQHINDILPGIRPDS